MRVARTSTALRAVAHRSRLRSDNAKRRQPCAFCTQQLFARSTDDTGNRRQLLHRDDGQYAGPPFAGAAKVLAYLGRYTHRVAIANHRLVDFDGEHVRFRWRDYAHGNKHKIMSLKADEFVRRFLLHTLPRGLVRIRHYGLLANRSRRRHLAHCRMLVGQCTPEPREAESADAMMLRLTGIDITRCPRCEQGRLHRICIVNPLPVRSTTHDATGPP